MSREERHTGIDLLFLGYLYLAKACVPVILFGLYRFSRAESAPFWSSRPGVLVLVSASALALFSALAIHRFLKGVRSGTKRGYLLTCAMNLLVVFLMAATGEVALRLISVKTPEGLTLGGKLLRPRIWEETAERHRQALRKAAMREAYLVFDEQLGWTVGPNRVSEDRRYFSSAEGIRSGTTGVSFARQPGSCRIAILGDSFAFGKEVSFEDTWGHQLELALGQRCQVLNFGVPGYGVDQMYLRYMKEVRVWNPDVVIFAFIDNDVARSMSLYGSLLFPNGTVPFPKPRFVLAGRQLSLVNSPLPEPDDVFAQAAIQDLPFITYDRQYNKGEWDRPSWRPFYHSFLFRFLISWHALWEWPRGKVSDQAMKAINREIFRSFLREVSSAGSTPALIYLPFTLDYLRPRDYEPVALTILRNAGIRHVDLRPCLSHGPMEQYFMPRGEGQHYSPEGNRQIARCVHDVLRPHLGQPSLVPGSREF